MDTGNFSITARRATEKDIQVADLLHEAVPELSYEELFKELQSAKENISTLSAEQLLRKDMKSIGQMIAVCSMPLLSSTFAAKYSDIIPSLSSFCNCFKYDCVVLVGMEVGAGDFQRDLAVYATNPELSDKVLN